VKGIGKALMWILVALLGAGVVAVGVTWFVISQMTQPPATAKEETPLAEQQFVLSPEAEKFLVPLKDEDRQRFLEVTVRFVMTDEKDLEKFNKVTPFIRNAINGFLMERTAAELKGQAGIDLIATGILARTHQVMGEDIVKQVLVESMVVQ
jgi:flagellar basal body-associated protein FliL